MSWRGQSWQSSLALQRPSHCVRSPTTGRGACTPALLVGYHRQTGTVWAGVRRLRNRRSIGKVDSEEPASEPGRAALTRNKSYLKVSENYNFAETCWKPGCVSLVLNCCSLMLQQEAEQLEAMPVLLQTFSCAWRASWTSNLARASTSTLLLGSSTSFSWLLITGLLAQLGWFSVRWLMLPLPPGNRIQTINLNCR